MNSKHLKSKNIMYHIYNDDNEIVFTVSSELVCEIGEMPSRILNGFIYHNTHHPNWFKLGFNTLRQRDIKRIYEEGLHLKTPNWGKGCIKWFDNFMATHYRK